MTSPDDTQKNAIQQLARQTLAWLRQQQRGTIAAHGAESPNRVPSVEEVSEAFRDVCDAAASNTRRWETFSELLGDPLLRAQNVIDQEGLPGFLAQATALLREMARKGQETPGASAPYDEARVLLVAVFDGTTQGA